MRTREDLERSINAFPLKTGKRAFFEDIAKKQAFFLLLIDYYRQYIYPCKPLEEYELPLMQTAVACMRSYDKTKGEFLHLYNGEMKKAMRRAKAEERSDRMRQGLKLTRDDERLIQKIIAFARKRNLDMYDVATQRIIAVALHVPSKDVANAIFVNDDAVAVPSAVKNRDGETVDLFDLQADKCRTAEETVEETDAVCERIARIDRAFLSARASQKRLLSMILTGKIIEAMDYDMRWAEEVLQNKALYNREIFAYYREHAELPTQKQIGLLCGLSEQSVSRTINIFKKRLKETV